MAANRSQRTGLALAQQGESKMLVGLTAGGQTAIAIDMARACLLDPATQRLL